MSGPGDSLRRWRASRAERLSAATNAALWLLPFIVFAAIYHRALDAWWMNDDSAILLSVISNGILPHFYRPMTDLGQPPSNLTPWLFATYGIDFTIGGLEPRGAYLHHFLAWAAVLAALTVALRRWLRPVVVALVLVWFILAVPTSTVVELLCTRHYLEGLLFATLCVLAYAAYLRRARARYLALSAVLYAAAMLAKEVFVPLGPLLVLHFALFADRQAIGDATAAWSSRNLWRAATGLWPLLGLAAAYVAYRGYMLGFDHLLSGYDVGEWRTQPSMLLDFPATWESTFRWPHWQFAGWLALIFAGLALWFRRGTRVQRWRGTLFGAAVAVGLLAPIYPVLGILGVHHWNWHYLAIPGLAFFSLAGWASQVCADSLSAPRHGGSAPRRSAALLVLGLVLLSGAQFRSARLSAWPWHKDDHVERYRVEGTYELYSADRTTIVDAIGPSSHHIGLQQIRAILLHLPAGPMACAAGECVSAVARPRASGGGCVRYRPAPPRLEDVSCMVASPDH